MHKKQRLSLGSVVNANTAFEAGASLTFNFSSGTHAFGLYVIGTQDIGAGDITLTAGGDSVASTASPTCTGRPDHVRRIRVRAAGLGGVERR